MADDLADDLLIDTNVIIDALRAHPPAVRFLEGLSLVSVSVVTAAELIAGCRDRREQRAIEHLLDGYLVLNATEVISQEALGLVKKFHLKFGVSWSDAVIAATSLRANLVLATQDKRHFEFMEGVKIKVPYQKSLYPYVRTRR